jgi:hypothetical protein
MPTTATTFSVECQVHCDLRQNAHTSYTLAQHWARVFRYQGHNPRIIRHRPDTDTPG